MIYLLITLIFSSISYQTNQNDYFEGKIIYESFNRDEEGELVPAEVLGRQEHFFRDNFYKFSMEVKGGMANLSFREVIVNTKDSTRYSVDHFNKEYTSLGMEETSTAYLPMELDLLHAQDTILGYPCKKYKILQLDYYTQTPSYSYLWVTEDLSIKSLPILAKIFGYRNTLIRDGSLNGIILRYESENTITSEALVVTATEVTPKQLDVSDFIVPSMYSMN
jgi:hypothetical protein